MSLMAVNEESDPSAILNGFWVTLFLFPERMPSKQTSDILTLLHSLLHEQKR